MDTDKVIKILFFFVVTPWHCGMAESCLDKQKYFKKIFDHGKHICTVFMQLSVIMNTSSSGVWETKCLDLVTAKKNRYKFALKSICAFN